jgi:hypothetical protein
MSLCVRRDARLTTQMPLKICNLKDLGIRPASRLADGPTINIRKPSQPDDEQKRVYQMLVIDWKSAFPTKKTEIPT